MTSSCSGGGGRANEGITKWGVQSYIRLRPPRQQPLPEVEEEGKDGDEYAASITTGGGGVLEFEVNDRESPDRPRYLEFAVPRDFDTVNNTREKFKFNFTEVFDRDVGQGHIYDSVAREVVLSALDGYNGTVFAYGQTGSGKTYTITGGERYQDRGMIPRAISTVFEEFKRRSVLGGGSSYSCYISYLEIYNENMYDLLDRGNRDRPFEEWPRVELMDDENGDMHLRNLRVYRANSEEDALNLLFLGNVNRVTSDTPMNTLSSRSHCIFTMTIQGHGLQGDCNVLTTSKVHLVDLAGSERAYKVDDEHSERSATLRSEGRHINLSLHYLEQVIVALLDRGNKHNRDTGAPAHIPYRNSAMTSVLRDSLGGNCKTVFVATLNSELRNLDETISSCRFATRCAQLSTKIRANEEIDVQDRIEILERENRALRRQAQRREEKAEAASDSLQSAEQELAQLRHFHSRRELTHAERQAAASIVQHLVRDEAGAQSAQQALWAGSLPVASECCALLKTNVIYASDAAAAMSDELDEVRKRVAQETEKANSAHAELQRVRKALDDLQEQHDLAVLEFERNPADAPTQGTGSAAVGGQEGSGGGRRAAAESKIDGAGAGGSAHADEEAGMSLVTRGQIFIKHAHGRWGRPTRRFVWLSEDLSALMWHKPDPDGNNGANAAGKALNGLKVEMLQSYTRVERGAGSKAFQRSDIPYDRQSCCLSLVGDDRTVDLEVEVEAGVDLDHCTAIRDRWAERLQTALAMHATR